MYIGSLRRPNFCYLSSGSAVIGWSSSVVDTRHHIREKQICVMSFHCAHRGAQMVVANPNIVIIAKCEEVASRENNAGISAKGRSRFAIGCILPVQNKSRVEFI